MKQKTRSSAKSRIRKTGTGKIKVMKASRKHLLQQKSKRAKGLGKNGGTIITSASHSKHIRKAMPGF